MAFNDQIGVTDRLAVELVTVTPDAPPADPPPVLSPEATPTEQAAEATIEHTGAGPPPEAP